MTSSRPPHPTLHPTRRLVVLVWVLVVGTGLVALIARPAWADPAVLASLAEGYRTPALGVFGVLMALRGLLLLPTTPILLTGAVAFSSVPWFAFAVALLGVVTSAALVYAFADRLGVASLFEARYPEALGSMRERLDGPGGFWTTAALAATPVLPTYLVCYAAALVHVPERPYLVAVGLGEVPHLLVYLVLGGELITRFVG